jgi:hypothetical protein
MSYKPISLDPKSEVQAVAARLITLCEKNEFIQAQTELYHPAIERIEVDGTQLKGLDNALAQEKRFLSSIDTMHTRISAPVISSSYFSLFMSIDVTFKNKEVKKIEEICVYKVVAGKIIFEQFFR